MSRRDVRPRGEGGVYPVWVVGLTRVVRHLRMLEDYVMLFLQAIYYVLPRLERFIITLPRLGNLGN